jgi:hypothetical protein
MKKVAILQSNYIPWKGYFDMIAAVDEFIIYDDAQYSRRDWRNRNQIKTRQGVQWLTVPVKKKGRFLQKIRDVEIDGANWLPVHWKTLVQNYRKTPYFHEIASWLEPVYLGGYFEHLSQLNCCLIKEICQYIGIKTAITGSCDYKLVEGRSERLADICVQACGTEYISGPAARNYIDEQVFRDKNIKLTWFDYDGYPEYPQLWGGFVHNVTILDLLFNCGANAFRYMKHVAPGFFPLE